MILGAIVLPVEASDGWVKLCILNRQLELPGLVSAGPGNEKIKVHRNPSFYVLIGINWLEYQSFTPWTFLEQ